MPVRACVPADLSGPLGLTFLAMKSQDTDAALDVLAPLVGPDTVVVSLQNGVNPPRIAARLGRDYIRGAWWIAMFPGLAIRITAAGANFLGDGLRDLLDPTLEPTG